MIHVILTILKIIGIIILILLGIILLILLAVLLIPVRYRISGYYKDSSKDLYAKVDMSWLLHFALYRFVYQGGIKENNLKILGIKVYPKEEKPKKKKKQEKKKNEKPEDKEDTLISEIDSEEYQSLGHSAEGTNDVSQTNNNDIVENYASDENDVSEEGFFSKIINKIRALYDKIILSYNKLKEKINNKIQAAKDKTTEFVKKATDMQSFIQDSENIEAAMNILIGLKQLLIHIRPRRLKIDGELGFEDPAMTGKVFGALAVLFSAYNDKINLQANFEEPVIDVTFDAKGRLTVVVAVYIIARLLGNKRIRKWIFRK